MELKANTKQMKEYGEEMLKISDLVNEQIDLLYSKIEHLVVDGVWQGISANKYYQKVMPDKNELLEFNKEFRKYGENLIKCSEQLEAIAKSYR